MQESMLKVGVLGASRIVGKALCSVAPGLLEVVAVAARERVRAQAFAVELEIPRAYGCYQELIDDPGIDAIYIALPCSEHVPWTLKALGAGKHVLCEKPFALHLDEATQAVELAGECGKILMEAHHWRYHPLVPLAEAAFQELGQVKSIRAEFTGALNNPGDIRMNPLLGPGVLMDFGCYLVQWVNWAAAASGVKCDPHIESAKMIVLAESPAVDMAADVELRFSEVLARLTCDMRDGTPFRAYVRIEGSEKIVHFENPLFTEGSRLTVTKAGDDSESQVIACPAGTTTYRGQLQAFCEAVRSGKSPLTSGQDILRTQGQLDEIYRVAEMTSRRDLRQQALGLTHRP